MKVILSLPRSCNNYYIWYHNVTISVIAITKGMDKSGQKMLARIPRKLRFSRAYELQLRKFPFNFSNTQRLSRNHITL